MCVCVCVRALRFCKLKCVNNFQFIRFKRTQIFVIQASNHHITDYESRLILYETLLLSAYNVQYQKSYIISLCVIGVNNGSAKNRFALLL